MSKVSNDIKVSKEVNKWQKPKNVTCVQNEWNNVKKNGQKMANECQMCQKTSQNLWKMSKCVQECKICQ